MKILKFIQLVGRLKLVKRTGWLRYPIADPESVADHSFRLAVMAMFLAPQVRVDQEKVIKMALIHDLAEAKVGDVVKYRGRWTLPNLEEKLKSERAALVKILRLINSEAEIKLFDEYVANQTPEAQFVKELDKLEQAFTAVEYENKHQVDLTEFIDSALLLVKNPLLKTFLSDLEKLRRK